MNIIMKDEHLIIDPTKNFVFNLKREGGKIEAEVDGSFEDISKAILALMSDEPLVAEIIIACANYHTLKEHGNSNNTDIQHPKKGNPKGTL